MHFFGTKQDHTPYKVMLRLKGMSLISGLACVTEDLSSAFQSMGGTLWGCMTLA